MSVDPTHLEVILADLLETYLVASERAADQSLAPDVRAGWRVTADEYAARLAARGLVVTPNDTEQHRTTGEGTMEAPRPSTVVTYTFQVIIDWDHETLTDNDEQVTAYDKDLQHTGQQVAEDIADELMDICGIPGAVTVTPSVVVTHQYTEVDA